MEDRKMVKEIKFGANGAVAIITVRRTMIDTYSDGYATGAKCTITTNIDIAKDGNVITSATYASAIRQGNPVSDFVYRNHGLDTSKTYTMVAGVITVDASYADTINATIAAMTDELQAEANVTTDTDKANIAKIAAAKNTIAMATAEGVGNLMPAADIAAWRKRYNDLHNEGKDGYIPTRISQEDYDAANTSPH